MEIKIVFFCFLYSPFFYPSNWCIEIRYYVLKFYECYFIIFFCCFRKYHLQSRIEMYLFKVCSKFSIVALLDLYLLIRGLYMYLNKNIINMFILMVSVISCQTASIWIRFLLITFEFWCNRKSEYTNRRSSTFLCLNA